MRWEILLVWMNTLALGAINVSLFKPDTLGFKISSLAAFAATAMLAYYGKPLKTAKENTDERVDGHTDGHTDGAGQADPRKQAGGG